MEINASGRSDISAVLAQMRAMRAEAVQDLNRSMSTPDIAGAPASPQQTSFGELLRSAVGSVNELQQTSSQTTNNFVTGKENDLVKVMVDSQKANLGFQALVQVRNRMVSAYQDIMNMPI